MPIYSCSPRAHWFGPWEHPQTVSPYQHQGWYPKPALCTCRIGGLVACPVHPPFGDATNGGDFVRPQPIGERVLSDADVDRIARRVVELLREAKP